MNFTVKSDEQEAADSELLRQAIEALRAYDAYVATPSDRGGKNGPKGQAHLKFIEAKTAVLALYDKRGR